MMIEKVMRNRWPTQLMKCKRNCCQQLHPIKITCATKKVAVSILLYYDYLLKPDLSSYSVRKYES
jgi:hypothetical protein